ncbi:Major capsid protein precursor (GpN) [Escherichia coli]|nr:Major capsid protein precursor (GpN) [Escherichia coli]
MNDVTLTSRNMDNTVAHAGKYANADALVQDARSSLLDEWHKEADDLVVIMGRNLFNSLRLPVLNSISGQNPNAELLAGQLILSSRTIGGLGVFLAPFFPDANDADHLVQQPVDLLAERFNASSDERRTGIQPHRHLPVHQ